MTTAAFITKGTEIENKIPDTIGLVEETDYDAKSKEVVNKTPNYDKFITVAEFNEFSGEVFDTKLKQTNLIQKVVLNAKVAENEIETLDAASFLSKSRADFIMKDVGSNQQEIKKLKKINMI